MRLLLKRILTVFLFSFIISCMSDDQFLDSDIELRFSADSISFDTLISTYSTTTKSFRIVNQFLQSTEIEKIYLANAEQSFFRLNIDGDVCQGKSNLKLMGNDSIFVFVEATFPSFDEDSVCFQTDSIIIQTTNKTYAVELVSWSQDVHYKNKILATSEVWDSQRPYLITDSLEIPFGETLTIKEGVNVLFHESAFLKVVGDLIVEGSVEEPVVFKGDRFDQTVFGDNYNEAPGQWAGLVIYPYTKKSRINHAIIKNGMFGIWAGAINYPELPSLAIDNCIIKNQSSAGIISFGSIINCSNTFFANCNSCIALYNHGKFSFNHITINNKYQSSRDVESVVIKDYFDLEDERIIGEFESIQFNNSIIYGDRENEILVKSAIEHKIDVSVNNCLLRVNELDNSYSNLNVSASIINSDPLLVPRESNNRLFLDSLSPCINHANLKFSRSYSTDIFGISRLADEKPDVGAVEFQ